MRVRKKGLVILTIFSVMAWILTQNNLLLFLVFFAVTRWIDLFLVLRNIPKLKVERYITKTRLFVDEKARMVFKIINTGNMKLFLKLQPSLSPVRFFKKDSERIILDPLSSKELTFIFSYGTRGKKILKDFSITFEDTFAMFSVQKVFEVEDEVIVFPEYLPITFYKESLKELLPGRKSPLKLLEDNTMLKGLRDYNGEPMNRIHWKASARYGKLLVKEHDHTALGKVKIFLDLNLSKNAELGEVWKELRKHYEEEAVKLVASVVKELKESHTPVELVVIGERVWKNNEKDWVSDFELLATVKGTDTPSLDTRDILEVHRFDPSDTVLLFCVHLTMQELPLLLRVRSKVSKLIVFVIPYGLRDPNTKPFRSYLLMRRDLQDLLEKAKLLEENHVIVRGIKENMTFQEALDSVP
ncbi:hypothetical protein TRQ7_08645 [Thermotoga sp. RQ7]|uniref:DUF58 domain-containing protein n=1 Tax=Thermotoga sp. RQ7 TaxID=126738 RepID=UPI0005A358D3|nr:DUF58 domain-containing protein [Thermotoga sp. RQ7]AJG41510.1 hypothetical protein TRQ7_08645 [Thermotoga sp. RQ7]